MKIIDATIMTGQQDVILTEFGEIAGHKVKIEIKSDSYAFQCYARSSVWSKDSLSWNLVAHIPYGAMETEPGLYYKPMNRHDFDKDREHLIKLTEAILS